MRFDLPDGRQERPTGLVVGFCSQFRGEGEPAFYGPKPPYAEAGECLRKGHETGVTALSQQLF